MELYVGVDIGGTKVAAALVDDSGLVRHRIHRNTPHRSVQASVVEQTLTEVISDLIEQAPRPVAGIGIAAAGFVDVRSGVIHFAPHLAWRHEPLAARLSQRLGRQVIVENDANASLWAEWRHGAAQGHSPVVLVSLGTGIGGAVLVEGRLRRGRNGMAGEFGHMQVVPAGLHCECGKRGCWEQYSSGNALVRQARQIAVAGQAGSSRFFAEMARNPERITGPGVTSAARGGDQAALQLLAELGHWLGVGLANLAAAFDPEIFLVGGGVSAAGELLLEPARQSLASQLPGGGFRPLIEVLPAALGPDAGVIGAADLSATSQ